MVEAFVAAGLGDDDQVAAEAVDGGVAGVGRGDGGEADGVGPQEHTDLLGRAGRVDAPKQDLISPGQQPSGADAGEGREVRQAGDLFDAGAVEGEHVHDGPASRRVPSGGEVEHVAVDEEEGSGREGGGVGEVPGSAGQAVHLVEDVGIDVGQPHHCHGSVAGPGDEGQVLAEGCDVADVQVGGRGVEGGEGVVGGVEAVDLADVVDEEHAVAVGCDEQAAFGATVPQFGERR